MMLVLERKITNHGQLLPMSCHVWVLRLITLIVIYGWLVPTK